MNTTHETNQFSHFDCGIDYETSFGVYHDQRQCGKVPTLSKGKKLRAEKASQPISQPSARSGKVDPLVDTDFSQSAIRIKSTSPNIALLFSLFDVLQEENESCSPSSSASSPISTGSDFSDHLSSPQYETYSEETFLALPLESSQWYSFPTQYNSFAAVFPDRVTQLTSFADFN